MVSQVSFGMRFACVTCALASKPHILLFWFVTRIVLFHPVLVVVLFDLRIGFPHGVIALSTFFRLRISFFCLFQQRDEDRVPFWLGGQWFGFVGYSKYFLNDPNLVVSLAIYIKRFLFGRNTG